MHKINNYEKYKLDSLKLNMILFQMVFFNDIKEKMVSNNKLFSKKNKKEKSSEKENCIDLHLELTKKVDEIIEKNKIDEQLQDKRTITPSFVEIRQQYIKGPQIPVFQTDLGSKTEIGEIEDVQEFIEIESPTNFLTEKQQENKEISDNWIDNKQNENKKFFGLGALKIGTKTIAPEKTFNTKNTRNTLAIELEETKKEIERKKRELEEAIKKEKLKELELKKQQKEKQKLEKLKKLELKKKLKEEKIKEKLAKKIQKEKEKELKKQELLKIVEMEKKVVEEEKIPPEITDIKEEEKETSQQNLIFDEDVAKLLPILDNLFGKLPEETVDEFIKSEYFELYEKVLLKYKNKG